MRTGQSVEATDKLKFSEAKQVKVRSQQTLNPVKQELLREKISVNQGKVREESKPQIKGRRGK